MLTFDISVTVPYTTCQLISIILFIGESIYLRKNRNIKPKDIYVNNESIKIHSRRKNQTMTCQCIFMFIKFFSLKFNQ